jgi:hypothetical protein
MRFSTDSPPKIRRVRTKRSRPRSTVYRGEGLGGHRRTSRSDDQDGPLTALMSEARVVATVLFHGRDPKRGVPFSPGEGSPQPSSQQVPPTSAATNLAT